MKIFISSLITGMEEFRAATREAILQLGHEPVMAEDFGARPHSSQIACLDGIRQSGLVVLLLGVGYGTKQTTGLSPTHEEYREAKGNHSIIAFVQEGITPDADQAEFIKEVQAWEGGLFRGSFSSPEKLKTSVTRAIHEWQISTAAGPLNPEELLQQAVSNVTVEQREHRHGVPSLVLSVTAGPTHAVLRPSEIEKPALAKELLQEALFGQTPIFTTEAGNDNGVEGSSLIIQQESGNRVIKLDPQGGLLFRLKLEQQSMGMVVIKEQLEQQIVGALKYAAWVLDRIDPTQRLTHVALALSITDADYIVIRTQAEHDASPNSYSMGHGQRENRPVHLTPPHRPRAALSYEAEHLAEDLNTLLRRESGNAGRYR